MRRNRKNVARNEAKSSFGHVRALSLGEIGESLRAKRWGRPWDEEVEDTGLFKTRVPRNAGHLVRNLVERQRTLPFLRSAPEFDDRAAVEIRSHGLPPRPNIKELLAAVPAVRDAVQLRIAYAELDVLVKEFQSPEVLTGVALFLEHSGQLPPRPTPEMRENAARRWLWKFLNAAIELGTLGQRLEVREHERDTLRGRKTLESARQGHAAKYGTTEERARRDAEYLSEYQRIVKANRRLSPSGVARRVAEKFGVHPRTIRRHVSLNSSKK